MNPASIANAARIALPASDTAWFVSDLHLWDDRPRTCDAFAQTLDAACAQNVALFVLGDLFEYWAGDDDLRSSNVAAPVEAMRDAVQRGLRLWLMHGNRDFLLGPAFAKHVGATLITTDHALLSIGNAKALLMHGDTLCTDDVDYQRFRAQARHPAYQAAVLAKPLAERHALIAHLRMQSEDKKARTAASIMDVNPSAVNAAFDAAKVDVMIHGHTHRPMQHQEDHGRTRWVLPDWECESPPIRGGYLEWNGATFTPHW
ncbi:MAG TPA: UDP-2,3-diacylglucosamine diphosphatase [Burkholderiaceae bacterium]|nr:UDP-2,3-diacylglucosamine diphosphatase [Burkholderiaceae bacterium]